MLEQNKVGTTPNRFRRGVVDGKWIATANRLLTTRQGSGSAGLCLVAQSTGNAIHYPDEIDREAVPVVVAPCNSVSIDAQLMSQSRFCPEFQNSIDHSAWIVPGHQEADVFGSD